MILLDVSPTMDAEDMADGRSRLQIAKETLEEFVKGRVNDRIGLVMFSGEPFTLSPLTLDYGALIRGAREAEKGLLRDGTAQGDALALTVSHLKDSRAKSRIIVFLTDGENNTGKIAPETAADIAQGFGIKVYTIGIGKQGRIKIPIKRPGVLGNTVTTYQWHDNVFYPEWLKQLADTTGGKFYRVEEADALSQVFHEIDQLEQTEVTVNQRLRYEDQFELFLKIALILFIIEQLMGRVVWRLAT